MVVGFMVIDPSTLSKHSPKKTQIQVWWDPSNGLRFMDVSENSGTPKSSILIGIPIINHPFWGTPIFGSTHISPT